MDVTENVLSKNICDLQQEKKKETKVDYLDNSNSMKGFVWFEVVEVKFIGSSSRRYNRFSLCRNSGQLIEIVERRTF